MRVLIVALCLLATAVAHAGTEPYNVANIPAALLDKADAVKRIEEIRYEITGPGDARLFQHWAVTVLNEAGKDAASFVQSYNKMYRVVSVDGTLYDAQGKQLRTLKPRDVGDQSAVDGGTLMDDNRVRFHHFDYPSYPYTVEYWVEIRSNTTLFLHPWVPQNDESLSVEKSTMTVATTPEFNYRFKAFRYNGEPEVKTGKWIERTWTVQSLPAFELPFAAPLIYEMTPCVFFAAKNFNYGDYTGSGEDWRSFGSFILSLNKGRDELTPALKQKVHELTDGIADQREKIRRLYQYLQQNTRYISIQMGVGGLQTFDAQFVAQKGYGDCKALTNFMYSLLKEAGVTAHYTVVMAGERASDRYLIEELPFSQFNHVILCVPGKDTTWLECTSQTMQPGYMGAFTGNRTALAITAEGGKLVQTPRYNFQDNLQARKASGVVSEDGTLNVALQTLFRAEQQDDLAGMVQTLSRDRVKRFLDEHLGLPAYEVIDFRYEPRQAALPELTEHLRLQLPAFASVSGKRLFLAPNFVNRSATRPTAETRSWPICLRQAYTDIDSTELTVPAGYEPESLPKPVSLRTPYGNYSIETKIAGNKVLCIRRREAWPGTYPASEWEAVKSFFEAIYKADRATAVLVKK